MKICVLAALLLSTSGPAWSETYQRLHQEGDWALYRINGLEITTSGKEIGTFDGVCLLEGSTADSSLKISSMPPALVELKPEYRDWLDVRISNSNWNFRHRHARATLSVGMASYGDRKANYEGNTIGFSVPEKDFEHFGIFLMFAGVGKTITVLDSRKKVIAQLSTDGFAAVRDKFLDCAGL